MPYAYNIGWTIVYIRHLYFAAKRHGNVHYSKKDGVTGCTNIFFRETQCAVSDHPRDTDACAREFYKSLIVDNELCQTVNIIHI